MAQHILRYPAHLKPDDNDTFLVTFPDFPEAVTFGDTEEEALSYAVGCLREAIAARIANREDIPTPSAASGKPLVAVPPMVAAKALLYQSMRDENVSKAELGRRLNWERPQVDRLFQLNHQSKIEQLAAAAAALGLNLIIGLEKHVK